MSASFSFLCRARSWSAPMRPRLLFQRPFLMSLLAAPLCLLTNPLAKFSLRRRRRYIAVDSLPFSVRVSGPCRIGLGWSAASPRDARGLPSRRSDRRSSRARRLIPIALLQPHASWKALPDLISKVCQGRRIEGAGTVRIVRTFDQATASVCATCTEERSHVHVTLGGSCGPKRLKQMGIVLGQ